MPVRHSNKAATLESARSAALGLALALTACGSDRAPASTAGRSAPAASERSRARVTAPESKPTERADASAPAPTSPSDAAASVSTLALQFEGTPSVVADRSRFTCTGRAPAPGTALRDVNLCDLLVADAAKDKQAPHYELVAAHYADVRPTWSSHGATLCDGEEIVLVVEQRKHDDAEPRECVQLRCVSSFPPAPARIGKNGEFCRSDAGVFEAWTLSPGRVEARHEHALSIWHLNPVGERFEYIRR